MRRRLTGDRRRRRRLTEHRTARAAGLRLPRARPDLPRG